MVTVQRTVLVDASPEDVWAVVNDVDRWPEWITFTDRVVAVSDGPFGEGTVYREEGGPGPLRSESEWRVTAFERPRRQVHYGDVGPMQGLLTIELDPVDGYTRVYQTIEVEALPEFRPLGRMLEWLVVRPLLQSGTDATLRNLKRVVEEGHAVGSRRRRAVRLLDPRR